LAYAPREGLQDAIGSHLIGCWVAVLGTAVAVAFGFTLYASLVPDDDFQLVDALLGAGLPALLVASVLTALGLLVFGLPATWLLARLERESGPAYFLTGGAAGAVLGLIFLLMANNGSGVALLVGAAPGALCGWLWWRFARRDLQRARIEAAAGIFE
jgi:hypothetical protein